MSEPSKGGSGNDAAEKKALREGLLRMALTSEARQRLANVRMVKPDLANSIEEYIVQLASSGKLKQAVDDEQVKQMLQALQGQRRETKIRRL